MDLFDEYYSFYMKSCPFNLLSIWYLARECAQMYNIAEYRVNWNWVGLYNIMHSSTPVYLIPI